MDPGHLEPGYRLRPHLTRLPALLRPHPRQAPEGDGPAQVPGRWAPAYQRPRVRRRPPPPDPQRATPLAAAPADLRLFHGRSVPRPRARRLHRPRIRHHGRHTPAHLPGPHQAARPHGPPAWLRRLRPGRVRPQRRSPWRHQPHLAAAKPLARHLSGGSAARQPAHPQPPSRRRCDPVSELRAPAGPDRPRPGDLPADRSHLWSRAHPDYGPPHRLLPAGSTRCGTPLDHRRRRERPQPPPGRPRLGPVPARPGAGRQGGVLLQGQWGGLTSGAGGRLLDGCSWDQYPTTWAAAPGSGREDAAR
jgi:hypothetical protein